MTGAIGVSGPVEATHGRGGRCGRWRAREVLASGVPSADGDGWLKALEEADCGVERRVSWSITGVVSCVLAWSRGCPVEGVAMVPDDETAPGAIAGGGDELA